MVAVPGPDLCLNPVTWYSDLTHAHTNPSISPPHLIHIIFCVESGVIGLFIQHNPFISHIYHAKLDLRAREILCV